ncbi:MAG TPA: DUF2934 domain-containing protein, partial [Bryobacteraceae bacterium]|nr:DUF2934 domain-containing protein [Bryobacteraceae bacterium]
GGAELKPKPRTSKSSAPKTTEVIRAETPTHHHKLSASPVAEALAAVSESSSTSLKSTLADSPGAITHQQIAELAHSFWSNRGHSHGSPEDDWLRAERQLTSAAAYN